ncbi:hypothetical protein GCM10010406_30320 [Streptomyces thermolineatus]|uniref:Uncharacterized protein n=1 Tax=Streptomyces thermolineatus TaxID=44033 RepID=A0ABN3LXM4_9ACTN
MHPPYAAVQAVPAGDDPGRAAPQGFQLEDLGDGGEHGGLPGAGGQGGGTQRTGDGAWERGRRPGTGGWRSVKAAPCGMPV